MLHAFESSSPNLQLAAAQITAPHHNPISSSQTIKTERKK